MRNPLKRALLRLRHAPFEGQVEDREQRTTGAGEGHRGIVEAEPARVPGAIEVTPCPRCQSRGRCWSRQWRCRRVLSAQPRRSTRPLPLFLCKRRVGKGDGAGE